MASVKSFFQNLTLSKVVMLAGGVVALIIVILFIFGIGFAIHDSQSAKAFFGTIRDIFIIILAFQGILITLALVILILQFAGLATLLQQEIKPLLVNIQETLAMAKGSAQFVGENVASPLIKAGGFISGASVFLNEFGGLRRAIRRNPKVEEAPNGKLE